MTDCNVFIKRNVMNDVYTKEEFMILAMLYIANVDGRIQPDEVRVMLERFEPSALSEVRRRFNKMNDSELIRCLEDNKAEFASSKEDRILLMGDLQKIVAADGHCLAIEEYILKAVENLLV